LQSVSGGMKGKKRVGTSTAGGSCPCGVNGLKEGASPPHSKREKNDRGVRNRTGSAEEREKVEKGRMGGAMVGRNQKIGEESAPASARVPATRKDNKQVD